MVGVLAVEQQQQRGSELAREIQMQIMDSKLSTSDSGFLNKTAVVVGISVPQQQQNYMTHHGMQFSQLQQQQLLTESRCCE